MCTLLITVSGAYTVYPHRDSNPDAGSGHRGLNPACLAIPPQGLNFWRQVALTNREAIGFALVPNGVAVSNFRSVLDAKHWSGKGESNSYVLTDTRA